MPGQPAAPTDDPSPPDVLGRCQLLGQIGRGGMGTVYRGRHLTLDIAVAVKVLDPERVTHSPKLAERFLREARTAAKLNHPNVVRVLDCGAEHGWYYLVMELVEGRSLDQQLAAGALPWRRALEITLDVARALEAAWAQRIVHRDVKPANVLLTADGRVKLADLGLAKAVDVEAAQQLTVAGQMLGTVLYMSPEQLTRPQDVDIRSDIYALGVTLFELLEGRPPFDGPDGASVAQQHWGAPRPRLTQADRLPGLQPLFERMVAIDPAARPQSPAELIAELQAVLAACQSSTSVVSATADTVYSDVELGAAHTQFAEQPAYVGATGPAYPAAAQPAAFAPQRRGTGKRWLWIVMPMAVLLLGAGTWAGYWWWPSEEPPRAVAPRAKGAPHGHVTRLGKGRVRIAYDFDDPAQSADFEPMDLAARMSIKNGELHVRWDEAALSEDPIAVVLAKQPLRVTRLTFTARVIDGDHINWYVQVVWRQPQWCPPRGYGGIFRPDGRLLCTDGHAPDEGQGTPIRADHSYKVEVDVLENGVSWKVDGQAWVGGPGHPLYAGIDRQWGLGTWASHVAFDNVVVEGEGKVP